MVEGILNTALGFWNMMFGLISNFLGMDPVEFGKDGVWSVISGINGSLQAIGLALIPIFFMFGMIKASATYIEMKRPEAIGKAIVRFCISWAVIVFGMQLLMWIWTVCQGLINRILVTSGFQNTDLTIPAELKNQLDHAGFFNSILLWILAAIGTLIIMVLSIMVVLSVYGRFFRIYLYIALAPIPFATFAGEPTTKNGNQLYQRLCLRLSGRRDYCSGLYHFFLICHNVRIPNGQQQRMGCSSFLLGRRYFQHAHLSRHCENGRQSNKRNAGIITSVGRTSQKGVILHGN